MDEGTEQVLCVVGLVVVLWIALGACTVVYVAFCTPGAHARALQWHFRRGVDLIEDFGELSDRHAMQVRHDLLVGRVFWSGNWAADFKFNLKNLHPVLCVCLSHPLNPVNQLKAMLILVLGIVFTVRTKHPIQDLLEGAISREKFWNLHIGSGFFAFDLYKLCLASVALLPATVVTAVLQSIAIAGARVHDLHSEYENRSESGCLNCLFSYYMQHCGSCLEHLFWMLGVVCLITSLYLAPPVPDEKLLINIRDTLLVTWEYLISMSWQYPVFGLLTPDMVVVPAGFGPPRCGSRIIPEWMLRRYSWWAQKEQVELEEDWVIADIAHPGFGRPVYEATLMEVEEGKPDNCGQEEAFVHVPCKDPFRSGSNVGLVKIPDHGGNMKWVKIERVAVENHEEYDDWMEEKLREQENDTIAQVRKKLMWKRHYQEEELGRCFPCCGHGFRFRDEYLKLHSQSNPHWQSTWEARGGDAPSDEPSVLALLGLR